VDCALKLGCASLAELLCDSSFARFGCDVSDTDGCQQVSITSPCNPDVYVPCLAHVQLIYETRAAYDQCGLWKARVSCAKGAQCFDTMGAECRKTPPSCWKDPACNNYQVDIPDLQQMMSHHQQTHAATPVLLISASILILLASLIVFLTIRVRRISSRNKEQEANFIELE
jgi:hypothetical protein